MIGNKLSASITFIRYCLCTQRVMHLIKHTENVMPSTNIDGIALNDKIINKPNHTKKYNSKKHNQKLAAIINIIFLQVYKAKIVQV